MRIDPKYFNVFIAVCAFLTLVVIIFGTMRYSKNQMVDFRENLESVKLDTLAFQSYADTDSLFLNRFKGNPLVIQFWSTWSGKSLEVNKHLEMIRENNPRLIIIAASVRDGDEQVQEYIAINNYGFHFVNGTSFFQEIFIPGVPSQILVDENGELSSIQVGDDMNTLSAKINNLLQNEEPE